MIKDRRSILTGLVLVAAAPVALATTRASAAIAPVNLADVKLATDFYNAVLPHAELSLATSQVASAKASQKDALEFAGFELGEAITVNMVLKDLGVTPYELDADSMAIVEKMETAEQGKAFDETYIALQIKNHEELRDLADAFLHNTAGGTDPDLKQGRHLAALMLAVFKEHVAITKRILGELKA